MAYRPFAHAIAPAGIRFGGIRLLTALLALLFANLGVAQAQILLPSTTPVTENFDAGTGTALPSGFKLTNGITLTTNGTTAIGSAVLNFASTTGVVVGMAIGGPAASNIPAGATVLSVTGTTVTMSANATAVVPNAATVAFSNGNAPTWTNTANVTSTTFQTTAGSATGGSYAYTSSTASDRAIGFQTSTSFLTPQSVLLNYRNTSTATMTDLSVSFTIERYRVNTTNATVDFYYSTDGTSWTAVPAAAVASGVFATGTAAFTFNSGTQTTASRTANISGLSIAPNGNLYVRWAFGLANANGQGLGVDNITATAGFLACSTPASQPTALTYPSTGTGQISGSFTAASPVPTGYLVVRYPNAATPTAPTNGVTYTAGQALGTGTVVTMTTGTSFIASGLTVNTNYDFYVYSYAGICAGAPFYRTASPLSGSHSTSACPTFSSTISINPAATRVDGSVYNTLTDALLDLSGCSISQPTFIELASNYVSTSETYPLVLGAVSGMSGTNTITIRPTAGSGTLSISGSSLVPATQGSIVYINGGTNWVIDGRPGGTGTTRALTIENTDNTTDGSAALRFINGAQNNLITYCTLKSANKAAASGCVNFSTSTTVGNNNNTISFCNVTAASTSLPNVGISSVGSAGFANSGNQILNNNIFDFFTTSQNSYGIYISDNTTNWIISGNSIYETAPRQLNSGADRNWAGIGISPGTASSVTGLNIVGNYIGGSAPNCGGSAMQLSDNGTGTLVLRGIFAQVGTATPTSIQGNTIQNIAINTSSTSSNQSLISAVTGSFNIGNVTPNVLGSATVVGTVALTQNSATSGARLSGIIAGVGTPGAITITGNTIGGLLVNSTGGGTVSLAGVYATGAASSYSITNNAIGFASSANGLQNTSNDDTWGIYLGSSTVSNTVSGNVISNLNSGVGRAIGLRADGGVNNINANVIRDLASGSSQLTGTIGMWIASSTAGQTISNNEIYSLVNTNASAATAVQGIYYDGPTSGTNLIERNFVHNFNLSSTNTGAAFYGVRVLTGAKAVNVQNNMVSLGLAPNGSDVTTGYAIYGIYSAGTGATNFYFNTSYIGGAATGITSNTFAFDGVSTGNTRAIQDNIFVNARDGGSTGQHYAFTVGGTGPNPAGLTLNYNLYQATGSNGTLALYNGSSIDDLGGIRTAIGQDVNSVSCDPKLNNPGGSFSSTNLHILTGTPTLVEAHGLAIGSVTTDFDGQTRSGLTPSDIGADAGNFTFQSTGCEASWTGAVNTDWANGGNWSSNQAPTAATPVAIAGVTTPQPSISAAANCFSLTLTGAATVTVAPAGVLNVSGDVSASATSSVIGNGKVVLKGSGQQNVTGTFTVSNLDVQNSSAQGVIIASGSNLAVKPVAATGSGVVTFLANSRLTNNGSFVLKSNSLATACIGPIPATAIFTGNLTQERKTPTTNGWYFVGAPFTTGADLTQWSEASVRVSPKNNANVFEFTEGDTTRGTYNGHVTEVRGWKVPSALTNPVNPSNQPKGYRLYLNSTFTSGSATLSATGTPLMQNVYAPFTFTPNGGWDGGGWNLKANPYPCAIDWNAARFDASNSGLPMSNAMYIWNGATANYGSYTALNATTGVGAGISSQYIASSQAFFIKTTGAGSFTFKESFKNTANATSFMRVAEPDNLLKVKVSQGENWDEAALLFYPGAADGLDNFDAENLGSSSVEIFTAPAQNLNLAIDVRPTLGSRQLIPLSVSVPAAGQARISFTGMGSFPVGYSIVLIDNFTGTQTDLTLTDAIDFMVTSDPASQGYNRFSVLITEGVTGIAGLEKASLVLWPNPAEGSQVSLSLQGFTGSAAAIMVVDALGKVVQTTSTAVNTTGTARLTLKGLAPGVYTVAAKGQNQTVNQTLLVR